MFKVYIVHEIGDYGLWDMTDAKVFSKFKDAEVYNEEYYKQHGYTLVITEWDVEQAKHNTYIHGINNYNMKQTNPNVYPITTAIGIIILLLIEFYKSL